MVGQGHGAVDKMPGLVTIMFTACKMRGNAPQIGCCLRDGYGVYKCIKRELSGYREKDGVQQKNTERRGPGPRLEVPTSEQVTRAEAMDTRTRCSGWRQREKYR